jgi:hypothetical protein
MILVIENRRTLEAIPPRQPPNRPGSLQRTLRRVGFHAARPAPQRPRPPAEPAKPKA